MKTEIAVTDSHALIWYARQRRKRLGVRARRLFERADRGKAAIYVPVLVVVEISEAANKGTIQLDGGAMVWAERLFSSGSFFPVDLTVDIVAQAERLYGIPERGDRLIAATAAHLRLPLITRDPEIAETAGVPLIW